MNAAVEIWKGGGEARGEGVRKEQGGSIRRKRPFSDVASELRSEGGP